MTVCLRHRSASGDLANGWEYDTLNRRVLCTMRDGRLVVDFGIWVCARERPYIGAHPLARVDTESFRIVPERFIIHWPGRVEAFTTIRCPIGDVVAYRNLVLTNAPADVAAALEQL